MSRFNWLKRMVDPATRHPAQVAPSAPPEEKAPEHSPSCAKPAIVQEDKMERLGKLTPRERELCLLLVEGYTLKESAVRLNVKYSTVNTHMNGVYRKLGVNSRAELIIHYRDLAGASLTRGSAEG